jgi:hypothetical protein
MNSCIETDWFLTASAGLSAWVGSRPEGRTHAPTDNGGPRFFNHQPASSVLRIDHCDSGFNMGRPSPAAKLSALTGALGAKRR